MVRRLQRLLHLVSPFSISSSLQFHQWRRSLITMSSCSQTRSTESWIEVSSQPSSSSLSSAAQDNANPAALGVQFDQYGRRRRRLLSNGVDLVPHTSERPSSIAGSSQEEYEESESDSDRIMTSSNENIERPSPDEASPQNEHTSSIKVVREEEDDDDENGTALGVANDAPTFTPPPNAFSHPYRNQRHTTPSNTHSLDHQASYFPAERPPLPRRQSANSYPNRATGRNHASYHLMSSTNPADHDAALRASLSTLLSCAAAARGLPKQDGRSAGSNRRLDGPSNRVDPSALRLIPESALPTETSSSPSQPPAAAASKARTTTTSTPPNLQQQATSRPRSPNTDKSKRKASPSSKDRTSTGNAKKKARGNSPRPQNNNTSAASNTNGGPSANNGTGDVLHPTLMTWVVSAGVVVIFSAIGFSAGYVIGREVGRVEAASGLMREEGVVCGREVGRGLRRLRWGSGSGGLSVIRTT